MALFGRIETVRRQAPATPLFAVAWNYVDQLLRDESAIRRRLLGLAAGASQKHDLSGGVSAIEQAYLTRTRPDGFFESHRKYIDIQVVVSGDEIMEVVDLADATVEVPYDESRDLIKYRDPGSASALRVGSGCGAVFFPTDVHMPCMQTSGAAALVYKSVLKVPAT